VPLADLVEQRDFARGMSERVKGDFRYVVIHPSPCFLVHDISWVAKLAQVSVIAAAFAMNGIRAVRPPRERPLLPALTILLTALVANSLMLYFALHVLLAAYGWRNQPSRYERSV
jgi:hypothetical protein